VDFPRSPAGHRRGRESIPESDRERLPPLACRLALLGTRIEGEHSGKSRAEGAGPAGERVAGALRLDELEQALRHRGGSAREVGRLQVRIAEDRDPVAVLVMALCFLLLP